MNNNRPKGGEDPSQPESFQPPNQPVQAINSEGEEEGEEREEQVESIVYEANQEGQPAQSNDVNPLATLTSPDRLPVEDDTPMDVFKAAKRVVGKQDNAPEKAELLRQKALYNGIFDVHGKQVIYDRKSLFCLDSEMKFRKAVVWLIEWRWFDRFITSVILLNSVMLAMTDYKDRIYGPDYVSKINAQLEFVDLAFTAIFIFESVSKILGMGFVFHTKSYLRDPWNWLDFFVVCVSLVNFVPNVNSGGLKALRTFRILRPLRTINAIPMMKQQIQSLLKALPGLANILTFLIFVYSVFAIFAVQSFAGNQYQYCRMTEEPTIVKDDNGKVLSYEWPIVDTFSWLCKNDKDCKKLVGIFGPEDLEVYKCGASIDYGIKAGGKDRIDETIFNEQILFDVVNFNHMGLAFLTIFQSLTMESWTTLMYNYMDSNNVGISVFFFIFLIIFGSFFTMQLVLAEIIESFQKEKAIREDEKREEQVEQFRQQLLAAKAAREQAIKDGIDESPVALPVLNEDEDKGVVEEEYDDSAFEDETTYDRDARRRSHNNWAYRFFWLLVMNPFFNLFIFVMIMLNTLSLAADDYPMSNKKEKIIDICNQYFTWLFTLEMLFKLIGLGPSNYKQDVYNKFDCFIVCISLIDWTIQMSVGDNVGPAGAVLQAFRAMRLLRIIKLARRWTALQDILGKIFKSLGELSIFCCLLLLFMYIFALLGMQFFAMRAYTDLDDVLVPYEDLLKRQQSGEILIPIRVSFNNIYLSLTTVFCVIFAEDWNWDMYYNVVPFGVNLHYYAMFFIVVFAFGNYVLFALFAAILLSHFEGSEEEEDGEVTDESDEGDMEAYIEKIDKEKPNLFKRIFSKETAKSIRNGFIDMFGKKLRKQPPPEPETEKGDSEVVKAEMDDQLNESDRNVQTEYPLADKTSAPLQQEKLDPTPKSTNKVGETTPHSTAKPNQVAVQDPSSVSESAMGEDAGILTTKLGKSTSVLLRHYSTDADSGALGDYVNMDDVQGTVFWIFDRRNACRVAAARLEKSKFFNNIILILIAISTVNLAIETPLDKPGIMKLKVLQYIDYGMTGAFTFEMCLKIFTYGFLLTGQHAYLKQGWNCLDFVIVLSALLGLNPNSSGSLKSLKTLRILRVLRPLKLASKNKGLKVAITALFKSLPAIGNLQLIILFFLFLFGILHTTLFAGQFWSCSYDHISLTYEQKSVGVETMWDCLNVGGEWVNNDFNFDQTLRSVLTLFCLQSTEGWVDNMWAEVDTTAQYKQPKTGNKPIFIIFGIFIEILINLLFLNLFVGVVIETFNEEKEKINKNDLLTEQQKKWIQVQLLGYQGKIIHKQQLTGSKVRDFFIKMVEHWLFDTFIMICIIGNTIVLMIKWYGMSEAVVNAITNINYVFMVIFTIEAVFKIYALRSNYFKVGWNIFDFIVVVGTLLILIIAQLNLGNFGIQSTILRSLRIGRVLRILRKAKKLQIIFNTLFEAMPSMASLGMLLLLLMFMYAIIGMSQFGFSNITDQENADYHANFQNFINAFLLLFRCATGEAWDSLMFDFGRQHSPLFQCVDSMEYEQYEQNGFVSNKCGNKTVAYGFFISFIIFCVQVFLNLFVAVIVDAFGNQAAKAELPVQQLDVEFFEEVWREFDGDATGFILIRQFEDFLIQLCQKDGQKLVMRAKWIQTNQEARRRFIAKCDIPTFKNFTCLMFYDVLLAFIRQKAEFAYEMQFRKVRSQQESEKKKMREQNVYSEEQILKIVNRKITLEFGGNFELCIESFASLDYTIDLINEIRIESGKVSKRFNLSRDKADEHVDEETGRSTYYTSKHFIYGTYIVNIWRNTIRNRKAQREAAYGEVISGRRKIMPISSAKPPLQNEDHNPDKVFSHRTEEGSGKPKQGPVPTPRKKKIVQGANIVDTDFEGK